MTLLELLVKELPQRGGWLAIFGVFPDQKFVEKFIEDFKVSYGTDSNCNQYIESEETGEIVTREQYEDAIAAQRPDWNGEGLPPVGLRVEYTCKKFSPSKEAIIPGNWYGGTIIAYYDDCVWTSDNGIRPLDNTIFRPLRTESDRNRKNFIHRCVSIKSNASPIKSYDFYGEIFDAIAAGKIPGVELTK